MSTDRDVNRIVRSWLEEGVTSLPDRVLDTVLDQLPATPQRRALWPVRRFRDMNNYAKVAIAAAAVVVIALVGINLLPNRGGVGGPGPSPTPNPTQTASPTQSPPPSSSSNLNFTGNYVAGTTYVIEEPCPSAKSASAYCVGPGRMTFTIPATGWYAPLEAWRVGKDIPGGGSDLFDLYVTPLFVGNVYTDGCHWHGSELSPAVGPTVDDLATVLFTQEGPGASPPTAVTVGGYPGKKVELSIPEGLDTTTCDSDSPGSDPHFGRFVFDRGYGAHPYLYGDGQHNTIYIVDVDGTRLVIDAMYLPGVSAADRAEQDQIVASIRFESSPASPSPSP
jgi:hypothetical protein